MLAVKNRTTAIPLLLLTLLFINCGGSFSTPASVHASPPPSFVPPNVEMAPCSTGCIAMQSPGHFLELRYGPVALTGQAGFTTTLPFPIHVKHLDAWIGTLTDSRFESDSRLQIYLPDGTWLGEWKAQWDKHQDVIGDLQRNFDADLDLPVGSTLVVYSTGAGIVSCPQGCGFDTTWSLSAH